jgi:hypothetical protein
MSSQATSAKASGRGLKTSSDIIDVMSKLADDILNGRIEPAVANVAIKAADTIVKVVEMEYKYREDQGPRLPIDFVGRQLPAPRPVETVEHEQPALNEIEHQLEAGDDDRHKERIREKLEEQDIANKILWTTLEVPARRLTEAVIEVRRELAKLPVDDAVETIVKSLNNKPAKKAPKRSIDEVLNGRDEGF